MIRAFLQWFHPAPHQEILPEVCQKRLYPFFRWRILQSTFLGYATFYLVRNNLSVIANELDKSFQITNSMYGNIVAATAISYGLGKFLLGSLADRSNPKKFMPFGLLLTAGLNFLFAGIGYWGQLFSVSSTFIYYGFILIWAMNGFVQGMGWPPCGRSIGHWYSIRERGSIFAIWNIAHNIGGGLAGVIAGWATLHYGSWHFAFIVPGVIASLGAVYLFFTLSDTPQSEGLPRIEEFKNDYPENREVNHEKELTTKELFIDYIFMNRLLWLFAFANFFVYIVRYSMLDFGPKYLSAVKGGSLADGGLAVLVLEFGGIPSTIFFGWVSDRLGGRRGLVSFLCMIPILLAFIGLWLNPIGNIWLDFTMLAIIGFFVYPPVMLLGVSALDMTSKKAVGVSAGFVGLFGYLGRAAQGKGLGYLADTAGWDWVIISIIIATAISIALLTFTIKIRPRS